MRCIEMNTVNVMLEAVSMININMRCIEINMNENQNCQWYWLTLTWDVLKSLVYNIINPCKKD